MSANLTRSNHVIIYLAFAALLSLGAWLRLRFIHTVQLYPDEFATLLAVQMIGEKGAPVMPSGLFYEHGLLFSYAGSLATWFGPARLTVRYTSLLFGLLTLGLTFWGGRRWFSPKVGLIAVTGLVIAPSAIEWSSRARMYALLQLLLLVTLWLAYEGIVQNRSSRRWAALVAYLGATLTHFVAVAAAPPLVLAGVAVWWQRKKAGTQGGRGKFSSASLLGVKKWKFWLEMGALFLILVIAFLVKRAGQPKGIEPVDTASVLPALAQVLTIYADLSLNPVDAWESLAPFYLTLPVLFFTPFAILTAIVSLTTLFTARFASPALPRLLPSLPSLFLSIILLTTTVEMIFFVSPERRDDKYLFMLLPVLFLLGAQGMAIVGKIIANSQWPIVNGQRPISNLRSQISNLESPILPLFLSGLILTFSQPTVHTLLANTGDDYDSAFAYLQAHWQPGDTVFTGTPAAAAFYLGHNDFYGVQRRGGYDYRLLTDTVKARAVDRWLASPVIRTEAELHQTFANHQVWLVLERWGLQREYYDLPFQQQLLAQTEPASEVQGIFILRSKANPQPLQLNPTHPVETNFGNLVRLTGYTVEPERPLPGESLRLTLYWQALASIPHDYTVFVHLRRPGNGASTGSGYVVAQADHRPLGNLYPMSLWPAGEIIRESSELSLPPDFAPGDYEVWAGLYRLETGERLPIQNDSSGENAVKLGRLIIDK